MSKEDIKRVQSEKLVKQVKYVYDNVECYRKRMDEAGVKPEDIKSIDDITKLPFTYKSDLRDYYPYGLFAKPLSEIVELHASSGTTGKSVKKGSLEIPILPVCYQQLALQKKILFKFHMAMVYLLEALVYIMELKSLD